VARDGATPEIVCAATLPPRHQRSGGGGDDVSNDDEGHIDERRHARRRHRRTARQKTTASTRQLPAPFEQVRVPTSAEVRVCRCPVLPYGSAWLLCWVPRNHRAAVAVAAVTTTPRRRRAIATAPCVALARRLRWAATRCCRFHSRSQQPHTDTRERGWRAAQHQRRWTLDDLPYGCVKADTAARILVTSASSWEYRSFDRF
jgi:hypothetical protein